MRLPPALLLLCLPGCLSLRGPSFVRGTAGSPLTIQCWYEEVYKGYNKYWCRGERDTDCYKIVETDGEERERRNGRVSIQDNAHACTLTVTVRDLHAADAGSYWCKIQALWILDLWTPDPSFQVQVSVSPAPRPITRQAPHPTTRRAPSPTTTRAPRPTTRRAPRPTTRRAPRPTTQATLPEAITRRNFSTNQVPSSCSGVPLSTVCFLLLVLLKVPLLLSMLGALVFVSRRPTGPGRTRGRPDRGDPPHHAPAPGNACPGIQPFRLDERAPWAVHSRARRQ